MSTRLPSSFRFHYSQPNQPYATASRLQLAAPAPAGSLDVRLPSTAVRTTPLTWVKLLTRVDPRATGGFGFEGKLYRPGERLSPAALPELALALECAGTVGQGRGHNRRETLYILWKYDRTRLEWRDIAQVRSAKAEWAEVFRPIALRELADSEDQARAIDPVGVADRVMCLLEVELERADARAAEAVLAVLHDRLAAKSVKLIA